MSNVQYSEADYKLMSAIKGSIYRALWGEVIPSMRGILLKWKPGDKVAWIYFYHTGEITDAIESHYSSIMAEVDADYWGVPVTADYEIIRWDPPKRVPTNERFIVYIRKEPFEDPT